MNEEAGIKERGEELNMTDREIARLLATIPAKLVSSDRMAYRLTILHNALVHRTLGKQDAPTLTLTDAIEYALQADMSARQLLTWVVMSVLGYVNDGEQVS